GWFFWTQNQSGRSTAETKGHEEDAGGLSIEGTTADAALVSEPLRFRTRPGMSYRLNGWMKGENVPPEAVCQIGFAAVRSKVPVLPIDKSFLAAELDAYAAWGKQQQVPLYLGEWGTIRQSFAGNRGGLRWAEDMLDLIGERGLSFAFHDYHEDSMGLYYGNN